MAKPKTQIIQEQKYLVLDTQDGNFTIVTRNNLEEIISNIASMYDGACCSDTEIRGNIVVFEVGKKINFDLAARSGFDVNVAT